MQAELSKTRLMKEFQEFQDKVFINLLIFKYDIFVVQTNRGDIMVKLVNNDIYHWKGFIKGPVKQKLLEIFKKFVKGQFTISRWNISY